MGALDIDVSDTNQSTPPTNHDVETPRVFCEVSTRREHSNHDDDGNVIVLTLVPSIVEARRIIGGPVNNPAL